MSNSQPQPDPQSTHVATPGDDSGATGFRPAGNTAHQQRGPEPQAGSVPWPDSPRQAVAPDVVHNANPMHTTHVPAVNPMTTGQYSAQEPYGTPPQGTAFRLDQPRPRHTLRPPLDLSDNEGASVTDSPDISDSREPRRSEPRASTPLLQRSLPKPLATLGQIGGIAALGYVAWGLVKGIFSYIMENPQVFAISAVILVMIVAVIFAIRKFNEREEERRQREEARDAEILRLRRLAGEDSGESPSTGRSGPARRSTPRPGNSRSGGTHR